jgi:hypothetical protein
MKWRSIAVWGTACLVLGSVGAYKYLVPTHEDAERALRRTLARLREDPSLVGKYVTEEYHRDLVRRYISCIAVDAPVRFVDSDLQHFTCRVAAVHCPEVEYVGISLRIVRREAMIVFFKVRHREKK